MEFIHVIAGTFQPIPRTQSNPTPYEVIPAAAAEDYNTTDGAANNRAFLLVERLDPEVVSDSVLERLETPETDGFQLATDDPAGAPTRGYEGAPSAPAPGPATWVVQALVQPQTLAGAKEEAQFERADKYQAAVAPGWPYPLPNGNSRRIPFTREFIDILYTSCAKIQFAESRSIPTAPRIPIRTDMGNFDRPKIEVYDNVAQAISDLGSVDLVDINLEQAIREADTPQECRAALDAAIYPTF